MVTRFEAKHKGREDSIIKDMLDVYREAEKVILGEQELSKLSWKAYTRTTKKLMKENPTDR